MVDCRSKSFRRAKRQRTRWSGDHRSLVRRPAELSDDALEECVYGIVLEAGMQPAVAVKRRDVGEAMPADSFDFTVVERRDLAVEPRAEHLVARAFVAIVAAIR